jgi:diadenosine tetraphosphatase ApaH/serine/threonine PP2A family protein phosphatase
MTLHPQRRTRVLLALLSDIHANRQAFAACLEAARAQGAERLVLLGDLVGYGGDPEWVVDTAMALVEQGAIAVRGNHDSAIAHSESMNPAARAAIDWTRERLSATQRDFLAGLPLTYEEEGRLYVHAEASRPARWRYVQSADDAAVSMLATAAQITFCGHIHQPVLYSMSTTRKMTSLVPTTGIPVHLLEGRQWLAVAGSVGQPRDDNPSAAFLTFDTQSREITYCRVAYDIEMAQRRIRDGGLPEWLAERLAWGR